MAIVRLYHGTNRPWLSPKLRLTSHPSSIGIWFTDDPKTAEQFARQASERWGADAECYVVVAEAQLENPKIYQTYADYLSDWRNFGTKGMRRKLLRDDHDAIIISESTTDFETLRRDIAVLNPEDVFVLSVEQCEATHRSHPTVFSRRPNASTQAPGLSPDVHVRSYRRRR